MIRYAGRKFARLWSHYDTLHTTLGCPLSSCFGGAESRGHKGCRHEAPSTLHSTSLTPPPLSLAL